MTYFYDPPKKWAIIKDCGNFPCTAPKNVLYTFEKSLYSGASKPLKTPSNFQLIANNTGFAPFVKGCSPLKDQNAYLC